MSQNRQKIVLVYPCVGGSYVGQLTNLVANILTEKKIAWRNCIAGVGANLDGFVNAGKSSDINIVIDGCESRCAKTICERHNLKIFKHYIVSAPEFDIHEKRPDVSKDTGKIIRTLLRDLADL